MPARGDIVPAFAYDDGAGQDTHQFDVARRDSPAGSAPGGELMADAALNLVVVIRAADLYLAEVIGRIRLVGADVSNATLLRRLGPRRWRPRPTPDRVIDWAAISLRSSRRPKCTISVHGWNSWSRNRRARTESRSSRSIVNR